MIIFSKSSMGKVADVSLLCVNTGKKYSSLFSTKGVAKMLICIIFFLALILPRHVLGQITTDSYTSNATWTCPTGVTSVTVKCWGGGGGGGSASFSAYPTPNNTASGGGGAGGAYAEKVIAVTPGTGYTVNVAATQASDGVVGNDSWFSTTGTVIAKGGAPGGNAGLGVSGAGGGGSTTNCIGDLVYAGGNGTNGNAGGTSGAGGGGAGSGGAGGNASGGTAGTGTATNGGNGAAGVSGANNGGNGSTYGGGGGGGSASCSWCAPSQGGGSGAAGYVTITYNGCATSYGLTSANGTDNQTVCINTAIANITYSINNGAGGATLTGGPAGVAVGFAGGVATISGTPTASGTFNYTVTATGACVGTPKTGSIIVIAQPTASAVGSKTICEGATATVSGASSSNGTILWTHNGSGTLSNATTTAPTYNSVAADAGNTVTLTMTITNSPCSDATASYSVIVRTIPPAPGAISGTTFVTCGGNTTLSSIPSGGTWTSSNTSVATINSVTGKVAGIAGGNSIISYTYISGGCTSAPVTTTVTVSGVPTGVKAVATPNPVCQGNKLTLTGAADGGVNAPTGWSWSGPNGFTSSSKSASIPVTTSAAAGTYTLTASNACGSVVVYTNPVGVGPIFNGGAIASPYLVCEGNSFSLIDSTSGATSWSWTGPNNFTSSLQNPTLTNVKAAVAGTYTLTASNACGSLVAVTDTVNIVTASDQSATYKGVGVFTWKAPPGITSITVEAWGAGGSGAHGGNGADGGGGGGGAYASSVVTVIPGKTYTVTIGAGGLTNCAGNTRVIGKNGGSSSFGSDVIAAGGSGGGLVAGTIYTGGPGGSAAASVGTIINAGGNGGCGDGCKVGTGPGNVGQAGTGNSAGGGGGDQYGKGGAGAGAGGQGGTGGYGTADPGSCGVTSPGGGGGGTNVITTGNNNGANGRVVLTYNYGCPARIVYGGDETMTSTDKVVICSGSNVNLALTSSAAKSFNWIAADNPNVTGESTTTQSSSTINNTLTNTSSTVQIVTYTVTPYTNCGSSPHNAVITLDPQVVTVTVNPPNITMITSNSKTICSGAAVNLSLAANAPSIFSWIAGNNASITGETTTIQNTDIITDILTNTTNAYQTVTYTVTPTTSNGIACAGTPQAVNITVINVPVLSSSTSPTTICSGTAFTYTPTSTSRDSSFIWSRVSVVGIVGADTSGIDNLYENLVNTTASSKDVTYIYNTSSHGCSSDQNIVVSVNPAPQGSFTGNTRGCGSIGKLTWTATSGTDNFTVEFAPGSQLNVTSGVAFDLPAGVPTADSTFVLTKVTDSHGCERTDNYTVGTATVTVTGVPTSLTSGPVSATICAGATALFHVVASNVGNYTWEESTDGGTVFTLINAPGAGPVYSNFSTDDLQVSSTNIANNGYKYRAVLKGGCGADIISDTATLSVNPLPVLTSGIGATSTVCSGDSVKYTPVADIVGSTFSWTRSTVAGISQSGTTGSGGVAEVLTNTTTSPKDVTYTYIATSPKGCSTSGSGQNVIVTINPDANIVLTSAIGTDDQSVCLNDTLDHIIYTFNEGATSATISSLPLAFITSLSGNVFTIRDTAKQKGFFTYTITTTGTCVQTSISGKITVGLGLASAVGTDTQSVCRNTSIVDIVYHFSGGDVPPPVVTGLPLGVTNVVSGPGVLTISGKPTVEGAFRYTVTTAGSCSPQSSLTGLLTVGIGVVTAGTDTQRVCKNDPITKIEYYYIGGGTPVVTGLPAGLISAVNVTNDTLTISGTPSENGIFDYEVETNGSCFQQSTLLGLLTVSIGNISPVTEYQSVCKHDSIINIIYDYVGGGTPIVIGLPTGLTTAVNGTNDTLTISGIPTLEGTYNFTVTTNGGICATPGSLTGIITVGLGPDSTSGNLIQNVCKGAVIQAIIYNVVGDTASVSATLPAGVSGIYDNVSKQFTINGTPTVEGTYNFTVSTNGGTCATPSSLTGIITVGLGLDSTSGNPMQNVCKSAAIQAIIYNIVGDTASVSATLPTGVSGIYNNISKQFTISGTPSVEGTYSFTVSTNGGTCAIPGSLTGIITVGLGLDSTSGNPLQKVCKGAAIQAIIYNVAGDTASVSTLPTGVSGIYNNVSKQFTISGTPSVEGTYNFTVSTNGGTCATPSSLIGIITVGLGLDSTSGNPIQNVCKGAVIQAVIYNVVGDTASVSAILPIGVSGIYNNVSKQFTISGTPSVEGTYNFTVSTNGGSCAAPSSLTGIITVSLGLDSTSGNPIQNVCKGAAIQAIIYNIVGDTASISATLPTGVSGIFNNVSKQFTISGTPSVEGTYNFTVSTNGGTCFTPGSLTGIITIGGGLDSIGGSNIQNICKNTAIIPIKYNIIGGSATISGLPSGVVGIMTNLGSPGVFTISGIATVEGIFNYTVTTISTCNTQSSYIGIIIVGGGLDTAGGSNIQNICKNSAITLIKYKIIGTSASVIGLPGGITGIMTTPGSPGIFSISGTATLEGIFNYTITTISTCAMQSSFTGIITVGGGLDTTGGSNIQNKCKNIAIVPIKYNIVGGSAIVSGLPGGVTGSITSPGVFTISGTPSVAGVFNYTVNTSGSCLTQSKFTGTVTLDESTISLTSASGTDAQTLCSNTIITNITYLIGGNAIGASVTALPTGVTSSYAGGILTISGVPTAPDAVYTVTVSTTGGACPQNSKIFSITLIHPLAQFTADPINGSPPLLVNFTNNSQNANAYNWYFGDGNISTALDTSNTYMATGIYVVQLITSFNSKCFDTATTTITVFKLQIPNVFTPNGDGTNDIFTIDATGISTIDVEIYNRWGTKMCEWHTTNGGWDGRNVISGLPSEAGTYYYIIKAKDIQGKEYNETGFVTLIR